jgi:hypothetical protein
LHHSKFVLRLLLTKLDRPCFERLQLPALRYLLLPVLLRQ